MIKKIIKWFKDDYNRRTFVFAGGAVLINIAFALYNGILGLVYKSLWNGSICVYYLFLILIRFVLIVGEHLTNRRNNNIIRKKFLLASFIILLLITLSMITPAVMLLENKRIFDFGLIPAIAMAAYTTYSITMAIINIFRASASDNILVKQLRLINVIAALMSILVLQNTLIITNSGYSDSMIILSTCSSVAIIVIIITIIIYSFIRYLKREKKDIIEE